MIENACTISLITLAIHAICWEGMVLFYVSRIFKKLIWCFVFVMFTTHLEYAESRQFSDRWTSYMMKPIFSCLICMSSLWTITLSHLLFHSGIREIIPLTFVVCGINVVLDTVIGNLRGHDQ